MADLENLAGETEWCGGATIMILHECGMLLILCYLLAWGRLHACVCTHMEIGIDGRHRRKFPLAVEWKLEQKQFCQVFES